MARTTLVANSQIFISYKREDEAIARRLQVAIDGWGFQPWFDRIDIKPGEDWDDAIHAGLRGSQIVVGLLTPESLASRNVLDEWGYALSTGKRLFLLWLREVNEEDIPPRYIRIQRIDVRTDEIGGFEQLHQALDSSAKVLPVSPAAVLEKAAVKGPAVKANGDDKQDATRDTNRDNKRDGHDQADRGPAKTPSGELSGAIRAVPQYKVNRDRMLEKVKLFWVNGVLQQSVYGAVMIELGIQTQLGAVENPWDTVLQHAVYGDYRLPTGTSIGDVYRDLNREMLILGNPGSGKTTTLLELARDMIAVAEQDDAQPIPVVFNLSSWADERKPLSGWLADELNTKYQVPRKVAKEWIEADALLLLLDGLDEVDARYRDACVSAINSFRTDRGFTPTVVCSRVADYEALSTKLRLNGAIVLQPLNDEQVNGYLTRLGAEFTGLRSAISRDSDLRELAESPLMLSIMTLAFRGLSADELPALNSVDAQRKRLFETYTRRMFERRKDGHVPPDRILHYLKWLAGRMVERKQSVFYIENLQFDWIAGERSRRLYRIVGRTAFGVVGGLLTGIVAAIAFFVLALLITPASLSTISSATAGIIVQLIGAFVFGFAGIGGLLFGLAGIQAYALDAIPDYFRPWKTYVRRVVAIVLTATLFGLLFTLLVVPIVGTGLIVDPNFNNYITYTSGAIRILALALLPFVVFGVGLGALTGSLAALIATVVNIIQPQRQLIRGTLQAAGLAVGVGGILFLFNGLSTIYFAYPDPLNNLFWALGLTAFNGMIIGLVAHFMPLRFRALPYILMGSGFGFFLVLGLHGGYYNLGAPYITAVVGALISLVVGRVDDRVASVDALRWSWSIRWSLLGLVGLIIITATLIGPVLGDSGHYTAASELEYKQHYIAPEQTAIDNLQANLDLLRTQWTAYSTSIPKLDQVEVLITRLVINQNQERLFSNPADYNISCCGLGNSKVAWDDLSSYTAELYQNYYYTATSDYFYLAGGVPTFAVLPDKATTNNPPSASDIQAAQQKQLDNDRADINARLGAYALTAAQVSELTTLRYGIMRREDLIRTLQRDLVLVRRNETIAGYNDRLTGAIRVSLVLGLSLILAGGVVGGLRKTEVIEIRTRPNSGMRRTFFTAIKVTMAFGAVMATIGGLVLWLLSTLPTGDFTLGDQLTAEAIPFGVILGMATGMGLGLVMGGSDAVVKHGVLRLFLMRSRSIPRNYALVLDEAAERILLRKIGGGYIFIHRYLLEYFASIGDTGPDARAGINSTGNRRNRFGN